MMIARLTARLGLIVFFLIPITHKFVAAIPLWIVGWLASS